MKVFKTLISFTVTLLLILALNKSWLIGTTRIPPLGKFLDPFHGFWQNIESGDVMPGEALALTGLKQPVTVVFDSLLIPHIFASTEEDLYLAQGYLHAMHRLWQMEFQTHAAAGRLSELIGSGNNDVILNYDRSQRRLGMVFGAQHALNKMEDDPVAKMVAEKYTEGINQFIHSLSYTDYPIEYKLMDFSPEDWTTLKCALLLKSMAQTLNMGDKDIQMTNALNIFGKEAVDLLYPDREPMGDPIVDNPGGWKFNPIIMDTVPMALPDDLVEITGLETPDPTIGSNNWAVHGSKTSTGSPILCNDPHLNTTLPSIWYALQLHAPGINSLGVSLPGSPGIIIGFNDSIAWGVTNAQRDLVDWYAITFENGKKDKYLLDEKWVDTKKVVEQFKVRGRADYYDTVTYTHWGPVPYDETFRAENNRKHYAFRWIAHDESEELMAFYKLNRAKNHSDYMEALNYFSSPAQNFAFASVSGDIAMRIQGKFPVRRKWEGKFALDGSKSSSGWQAFIPFEHNVMVKNPERGFVSSANQYPADSTYPYYINASSYEAYRNRRINEVLRSLSNISVEDMMKLQNDNYNIKAAESLPIFLIHLTGITLNEQEKKAIEILKTWDYVHAPDSEGAVYYQAWINKVVPYVWDELQREGVSLTFPTTWNTIRLIKEKPDLSFFDVVTTEETEYASDIIIKGFRDAVVEIEDWKTTNQKQLARLADHKDTYVEHLARLAPFSEHVQHGGNGSAVNASSRQHGPSWRMIVSLEKEGPKAFAVYPGGQSGNPGSGHYTDMLEAWSTGKYFRLSFLHSPEENAAKNFFSTKLNPVSK